MRISDWSSDVCSSDLREARQGTAPQPRREMETSSWNILRKGSRIEAAGQAIDLREQIAVAAHGLGPLTLDLDDDVGGILYVGEQEPAAGIAFAHLAERLHRLRIDVVHEDRKSTRLNSSH